MRLNNATGLTAHGCAMGHEMFRVSRKRYVNSATRVLALTVCARLVSVTSYLTICL